MPPVTRTKGGAVNIDGQWELVLMRSLWVGERDVKGYWGPEHGARIAERIDAANALDLGRFLHGETFPDWVSEPERVAIDRSFGRFASRRRLRRRLAS